MTKAILVCCAEKIKISESRYSHTHERSWCLRFLPARRFSCATDFILFLLRFEMKFYASCVWSPEDWWVSFGTLLLSRAQYLSCVDEKARTSRRNSKCQQTPNAASWSHFWIYMKIYIAFWISIYFKSSFAQDEDKKQDFQIFYRFWQLSVQGSGQQRSACRQQLINSFCFVIKVSSPHN